MTPPKPWPRDVVIIVCPYPTTALRERMQTVVPVECRDCHRPLVADGWTLQTARELPARRGRPIRCLCLTCYDRYCPEFDVLIDHRRHHD